MAVGSSVGGASRGRLSGGRNMIQEGGSNQGVGGGTGGTLGHRAPVECDILTLTLWALHGEI